MEEITPCIHLLKMPPFGSPAWDVSNVYFVGEDEVILIDSGYPTAESVESIFNALRELGNPSVKAIVLTHVHLDHAGGVPDIIRETGAPLYAHHLESESFKEMFPGEQINKTIGEGDDIQVCGINLKVLHMPGHTAGHLCFYCESRGILFTGDLVIGGSFAVIVPPGGNMTEYMVSLNRMAEMPLEIILPGHGLPVNDPIVKIEEYILHRKLREIQILKQLKNGPKSIPDMAEEIYAGLHPVLRQAGRMQILSHLLKMEDEKQVKSVSGAGIDAVYLNLMEKLPF